MEDAEIEVTDIVKLNRKLDRILRVNSIAEFDRPKKKNCLRQASNVSEC